MATENFNLTGKALLIEFGDAVKTFALVLAQLGLASLLSAATITVTNTGDSGPGSLPEALIDAADGGTIQFDLPLPAVISLLDNFSVNKDIQIVGPGAKLLTMQSDEQTMGDGQVIEVEKNHEVTISGVTITKGSLSRVIKHLQRGGRDGKNRERDHRWESR